MNSINKIITCISYLILPILIISAELTDTERLKIEQAIPKKATIQPKKARKILVTNFVNIKGNPGYGHTSIPYGNLALKLMGEKTGAYEMVLNNDTLMFKPENLKQFDAICFNNTTGVLFTDPGLRKSLLDFIRSGKGFIGFHAAGATMCQYPKYDYWPEFGEMLGGFEDGGHPWSADEITKIKLDDPGHPLNAVFGGRGFEIKDEAFQFRHGYSREKLHILLAIDATDSDFQNRRILPERMKDRDLAISWIRQYGKGRVFYCSFGHNPDTFSNPAILRYFLDGIQFALGDYEVNATPSMKPQTIETILTEIKSYEFGASRLALTHLSDHIRKNLQEPAQLRIIEGQLLDFLQSPATLAAKEYVCRELRIIGSENAVPVLQTMLSNDETSAMALYAMIPLPYKKVDTALMEALLVTEGGIKIGIINALGYRHCKEGAHTLTPLIDHRENTIAMAAVAALGEIGGPEAARSLTARKDEWEGASRLHVCRALLRCADRFTEDGEQGQAELIYNRLYHSKESPLIRTAALKGLVDIDKSRASDILANALQAKDQDIRRQAITFSGDVPDTSLTKVLISVFPDLNDADKIRTLSTLACRNDRAALPAVIKAAGHTQEPVRVAALEALGKMGDASVVMLLAESASEKTGLEKRTARESLYKLNGTAVNQTILENLFNPTATLQIELIRSIGVRNISEAYHPLLKTSSNPNVQIRIESYRSLSIIAGESDLPELLNLLPTIENESEQEEAAKMLLAIAKKFTEPEKVIEILQNDLSSASDPARRCLILRVLAGTGNNGAIPILQKSLLDKNESIRYCTLRALSNWSNPDPLLMENLHKTAMSSGNSVHRVLALRAYIKLIGNSDIFKKQEAVSMYHNAMKLAQETNEKKLILSGLSKIPTLESYRFAAQYLEDSNLKNEAEAAVVEIAPNIIERYPQETRAILETVKKTTQNKYRREQANELLQVKD